MVSTIILKTALPVTNKPLLLLCICCFDILWTTKQIYAKGAFWWKLIYMKVPEAFEKYHHGNVLLLQLQKNHGLKQDAREFWCESTLALKDMKYKQ